MTNDEFIECLKKSFIKYLQTSERSNEKLKILHAEIAQDIIKRLEDDKYSVHSLGVNDGKEKRIKGRYVDKKVDIAVSYLDENVAGFAVKFVMSNYSQNSNNYFENMLGETANIRSANIPYFQIFCIFDTLPYYDKNGDILKWEKISEHNIDKYTKLSEDCTDLFYHTPNKILIYNIHLENPIIDIKNKDEYKRYYLNHNFKVTVSSNKFSFGNNVIYNDYEKFITKAAHLILGQ